MARDSRITIIHAVHLAFACALLAQAGRVQLGQRKRWAATAERQHLTKSSLPAPRGRIVDASGEVLAESRELVKLSIAPQEVRDLKALGRVLSGAGVARDWVARATSADRKWVTLPGTFLQSDVRGALAMRGVYATPAVDRVYIPSDGVRRIVGRTQANGEPLDGIELALDSALRGERGDVAVLHDARGGTFESPAVSAHEPREGNTVTLTINHALQDICDRALADAVSRLEASGGDIVVLDPHSGEVLAMSSKRNDPRATASTALTEPYEPGSTLKPFVAGTLLRLGRAREREVIKTFGGKYTINKRTITDVHAADSLSLADVIRFSSNIGIVRFAERLSKREEYEALRDFGFGMPTGLPYPSEASGTLREPKVWSKQSPASLAMGYEIAVTPIQLATAYAAIANGGELLSPALVKEIRAPDGKLVYQHQRRVVRRVLPADVAQRVRAMLVGVVDSGTATDADLATFAVAGKSGTARRMQGRHYQQGSYTASFVGLFPAEDPQFVILVKLDNPAGAYYGGKTAAPVSKVVLEAAIAARDAALDRNVLASRRAEHAKPPHGEHGSEAARAASAKRGRDTTPVASQPALGAPEPPEARAVIDLAAAPQRDSGAKPALLPVPDVHGLPLRMAVHTLHQSGFKVELMKGGDAGGTTVPASGTPAPAGSVVRLFFDR